MRLFRISPFFLMALVLTLFWSATFLSAQHSTYVDQGEKKEIPWDKMVGRVVIVDGLAWGSFDKGVGQYVLMPHQKVYARNIDFAKAKLHGGLIRVQGILRKEKIKAAPKGAQGYSRDFEYFSIDILSVHEIRRVENDQLLPSKNDFLWVGMKIDDVYKIAAKHSLAKVALQVTTVNYVAYGFGKETIYCGFDPKSKTVTKIFRIDPKGYGRADDEWIPITGIEVKKRQ